MTADTAAPDAALPLAARNTRLGVWLLNAAVAFYYLGFVFAYVYLKTLDVNSLWRDRHDRPSMALGTLIVVTAVGAVIAYRVGYARRSDRPSTWRTGISVAIALTVVTVVLAVVELQRPGFPNGGTGYASVFAGWMWSYVVTLLGTLYWAVSVLQAQRRAAAGAAESGSPAGLRGFWTFIGSLAVLQYVLLYLVR